MPELYLRCSQCEEPRHEDEFVRNKSKPGGRDSECLHCKQERELARKYGISLIQYQQLLHKQGGVCCVCMHEESQMRGGIPRALAVDHCHQCGAIRGLLCARCNKALGAFRDEPRDFAQSIVYLLNHAGAECKG
jgi:hypothetical protein